MAFAKIAKRNNKNTIQTTQSRHYAYNKRFTHDKGVPFPHQAAARCKHRKNCIRRWFSNKCHYKEHLL